MGDSGRGAREPDVSGFVSGKDTNLFGSDPVEQKKLNEREVSLGGGGLRCEFAEKSVCADVASVVLEGGAIGKAREKITDSPTHPLLFDAQGSPIRDEMRMKMIKFEETLKNLAGALIDLANARILIEVFVEKIAEVLDFDPHGHGEGDEATGKGLGIGGGGGFGFGKEGIGGAGSVFDEKIGEATGDVAAGAF